MLVTDRIPRTPEIVFILNKASNDSTFPESVLKTGKHISINMKASIKAINKTMVDSPMNCMASCLRVAPSTFLMPISLARVVAFVVNRFI